MPFLASMIVAVVGAITLWLTTRATLRHQKDDRLQRANLEENGRWSSEFRNVLIEYVDYFEEYQSILGKIKLYQIYLKSMTDPKIVSEYDQCRERMFEVSRKYFSNRNKLRSYFSKDEPEFKVLIVKMNEIADLIHEYRDIVKNEETTREGLLIYTKQSQANSWKLKEEVIEELTVILDCKKRTVF